MSIREYVGARYVPKFFDNEGSNEWAAGVVYEPLTIVTYLNNSYTSKIPVPANIGNPANNPRYWVLTGNYNAQLDDIIVKKRVYSVEDIAALKLLDVRDGSIIATAGYNEANDGGNGAYFVTVDGTEDGGRVIEMANGLYANLIADTANVKQYGAYGDNVHDDTVAIQKCVDAGGLVVIPVGRYKTSAPIRITNSDTTIQGTSYNESIFSNNFENGCFYADDSVNRIRFQDFTINTDNEPTHWGIVLDNTQGVVVRRVNILGGSFYATKSGCLKQTGDTWYTLLIEHCTFDYGGSDYGVKIINTGKPRTCDCGIDDLLLDAFHPETANGGCLYIENCNDVKIDFSLIRVKSPGVAVYTKNSRVINTATSIEGGSASVYIDGGIYSTRAGTANSITNNGLINREVDDMYFTQPSTSKFTKESNTALVERMSRAGTINLFMGHNTDNYGYALYKHVDNGTGIAARFKSMCTSLNGTGYGVFLTDGTNLFLFGVYYDTDNARNVFSCKTTDITTPITMTNYAHCESEDNFVLQLDSTNHFRCEISANSSVTRNIFNVTADFTPTNGGIFLLTGEAARSQVMLDIQSCRMIGTN